MKNRIIAFLLAVLTVATSFILVVPASADDGDPTYALATESALQNDYDSVEEKVEAEMFNDYTFLYAQNDYFSLYANKYTGEVYLQNRKTNQWLTTNPIALGNGDDDLKADMLSQIWIQFKDLKGNLQNYSSYTWAATKGQISVSKIVGGIRVEYIIGETVSRYAVPEAITLRDFLDTFMYPLQDDISETIEKISQASTLMEQMAKTDKKFDISKLTYTGDRDDLMAYRQHLTSNVGKVLGVTGTLVKAYQTLYAKIPKVSGALNPESAEYQTLLAEMISIGAFAEGTTKFSSNHLNRVKNWATGITQTYITVLTKYKGVVTHADAEKNDKLYELYPILKEIDPKSGKHHVVYLLDSTYGIKQKRSIQALLTTIEPNYTLDVALDHERRATTASIPPEVHPVFRCALEYTLDNTGMTYTLPANSLIFDESKYILEELSVLHYFGANNMTDEGYVFYPDGSGALIDNGTPSVDITQRVYGHDYGYRTIVGQYAQPVRLPVYGAATTLKSGVRNGYLAVITEGDSLTELTVAVAKSRSHLVAYQKYDPRPSDTYMTSQMTQEMTIFSDVKYTGGYTTRIYMLTDPAIASIATLDGYTPFRADYVGMAAAYRHYLVEEAKVLSALDGSALESRLPLYIESFGFLETVEKFLTFPVEVKVPLTTFKDVQTMYGELAKGGISNVKFRLSGFYNGGYEGYYPKRLKIGKAVGGKDGYKALLKYAEKHESEGMEVFLSVDLMYNYYPGKLGTPSQKKTLARSMDNRYASRQIYDTVYQGYFSYFSMVVSADKLQQLFNKFNKKLSKFKVDALALDYMAAELSSNFDEDHLLDRESAKDGVTKALKTISSKYESIMSTGGNAYALKYVDYLLGAPIDSSRYLVASRTVPFYGMVMHGYMQYAGEAFNETGSPEYELLRAIESGASMYYILSYRNTDLIKDDFSLNKHYSVSYEIWKEDLAKYYDILDYAIGDLQTYVISDHAFLTAERIVSAAESAQDLATLESEYLSLLREEVNLAKREKGVYVRALIAAGQALAVAADDDAKAEIYDGLAAQILGDGETAGLDADAAALITEKMAGDTALTAGTALAALVTEGKISVAAGQTLHVTFDKAALLADAAACFDRAVSEDFVTKLDALIAEHQTESGSLPISVSAVEDYDAKTAYSFFTSSNGDDADYEMTEYSLSDGSVVLVTYSNGDKTVRLLLNFSIFNVKVKLDGVDHELGKYDFIRLDAREGMSDPRKGE